MSDFTVVVNDQSITVTVQEPPPSVVSITTTSGGSVTVTANALN